MPARQLWRDILLAIAGLALVALAAVAVEQPASSSSHLGLAAAGIVGAAVLASVAYVVWLADPAVIFTFAIMLSPFSGNWQAVGVPGPLAPDRLLVVAGIASVGLRQLVGRGQPRLRLHAVHYVLAAAVLYAVISAAVAGTLVHKDPFLKLAEAFGAFPFLVFLLAPAAFRTARDRNVLVIGLVVLGAYLGLTVVFEVYGPHALVVPSYIDDPSYGIHADRGRGPFAEAVTNGFGLFACAVGCAVALATWRRRWPRVIAAVVMLVCAFGTLLTLERSVWIGVVVGTLAGGLATPRLRRYVPVILAGGAIAVVIALAAVPGLSDKVHSRTTDKGPVWDRANLAQAAVNMLRARPLTGFGWGEFATKSPDYFQLAPNRPLTAVGEGVHNFFLTYAVELGLPGVTLWAFGLLLGVGGALLTRGPPDLEPWRRGLVPIAVFFLVSASFVPPNVFPNLILWLWAGVVWSGRYQRT